MKKQRFHLTYSAVCMICLLSSCTTFKPNGYTTMTQNVPLMKSKHELQVMFTGGFNHIEEQTAFSLTDHLALMANFYQHTGEIQGRAAEGGIGYFKHYKSRFVWEVYGIYTNSRNHAHVEDSELGIFGSSETYIHDFAANYKGYSLQFNAGATLPIFDIGMSFRYSALEYSDFYYRLQTFPYHSPSRDETYHLNNTHQNFFIWGPTIKVGNEETLFKMLMQLSFHNHIRQIGGPKQNPPYFTPTLFSVGLFAKFPFQKKEKDAERIKN